MDMENLFIVGEPANATQFSFKLGPGENTIKMLKPVVDGEATSI